MRASRPCTALAALLCSVLTGCSLFRAIERAPPPPPPAPPPAPVSVLPAPVATERFELAKAQDVVGVVQVVTATKEDTLTDIARRFNVGYEEILRANPKVDPWLPGEGREIVVPSAFVLPNAPRTGIVINIAAMRIFYYPPVKAGERPVVYTHPIGVGKVGWRTPEGVTKVVRTEKDPTWRVPVSVRKEHLEERGEELDPVIGPGPDNPLGKYALYLQWQSYLIHGTNKPAGVGLRSSHGCIRLYPEDIEQFYTFVPVGTQVRVVNQPFLFGWRNGELYLQPYDVLEDDQRQTKQKSFITQALPPNLDQRLKAQHEKIDWNLVSSLTESPRGIPVPVTETYASVDGVLAAAPRVENELPRGSTWDGKSDLPMDEASFKQLFSDVESGGDEARPEAAAAPQGTNPPPTGAQTKSPLPPKNGG